LGFGVWDLGLGIWWSVTSPLNPLSWLRLRSASKERGLVDEIEQVIRWSVTSPLNPLSKERGLVDEIEQVF